MSAVPEVDLSTRVYQAVQLVSEPDPALEAHTEWLIGVLLDRLKPEDLTRSRKNGGSHHFGWRQFPQTSPDRVGGGGH
jgi:hypothetical protein